MSAECRELLMIIGRKALSSKLPSAPAIDTEASAPMI
jgi:hypothetical protein